MDSNSLAPWANCSSVCFWPVRIFLRFSLDCAWFVTIWLTDAYFCIFFWLAERVLLLSARCFFFGFTSVRRVDAGRFKRLALDCSGCCEFALIGCSAWEENVNYGLLLFLCPRETDRSFWVGAARWLSRSWSEPVKPVWSYVTV